MTFARALPLGQSAPRRLSLAAKGATASTTPDNAASVTTPEAARPSTQTTGDSTVEVTAAWLAARGVEVQGHGLRGFALPRHTLIEAPAGIKRAEIQHSLELGAFSYIVSGYACAARIGRYCSIAEGVQIGRQNHPTDWASTSPALYLGVRMFGAMGTNGKARFSGAADFAAFAPRLVQPPTRARITTIGHDVWIGHGAQIMAGVKIGHGAIIAAGAVVARDVPPFALVAGNPAEIRRFRLDPKHLAPLLRSRWWRFAPWQLAHLDPSDVAAFLRGLHAMRGEAGFTPDRVDLRQGKP